MAKIFSIPFNQNRLSPGQEVCPLALEKPEYRQLRDYGCSYAAWVIAPEGGLMRRCGKLEQFHFDLFFIVSGVMEFTYADGKIVGDAGKMILFPSWLDREIVHSGMMKYYYFRFDNPESYPLASRPTARPAANLAALDFYFQELLRVHDGLANDPAYREGLGTLLHILLQSEIRDSSGNAPETVRNIIHYLNYTNNYRVDRMARKLAMSVSKLRKLCLELFNKSPGDALNAMRMTKARNLLNYSSGTMEEIAETLGYANRFSFSKAFCDYHGSPPVHFRARRSSPPVPATPPEP